MDRQISVGTSARHQRSGQLIATRTAEKIRGAIAFPLVVMVAITAAACSNPGPTASSPTHAAGSPAPAGGSLRHLPSQLLGFNENTSPSGQAFARQVASKLNSGGTAFMSSAQSALYGESGPKFLVWAAGWTSLGASNTTAMGYAKSAKLMSSSLTKNAQSFPTGLHGGALYCGQVNLQSGATAIECWWVDHKATGIVTYYTGSTSNSGDAASKTNQIRAVIEP